jgi:hypothetical protein
MLYNEVGGLTAHREAVQLVHCLVVVGLSQLRHPDIGGETCTQLTNNEMSHQYRSISSNKHYAHQIIDGSGKIVCSLSLFSLPPTKFSGASCLLPLIKEASLSPDNIYSQ